MKRTPRKAPSHLQPTVRFIRMVPKRLKFTRIVPAKPLRHAAYRLKPALTVLFAYPIALWSVHEGMARPLEGIGLSPLGGLAMTAFVTTVYGWLLLAYVANALKEGQGNQSLMPGAANVLFGIVYGPSIVALAYLTSWIALVPVALHVALTGRGNRTWAFIQNGVTAFAICVLLLSFGHLAVWPWIVAAAAVQTALLLLVEEFARPAFLRPVEATPALTKGVVPEGNI